MKHLIVCLVLPVLALSGAAQGQVIAPGPVPAVPAASGNASSASAPAPVTIPGVQEVSPKSSAGGYGESLRPTKRSAAARRNEPYEPIQRPPDDEAVTQIDMYVGESRVFRTPGVSRIAVGNGGIMSAAALDGKEVILFANAAGVSSLFVWSADGRYQRVKIIIGGLDDPGHGNRELAGYLSTIPNVKTTLIGGKVVVEGEGLSDSDLAKITTMTGSYPQILNLTNRLGLEQMVMLDVKVVEFPINELSQIGLQWGANGGAAIGGVWTPGGRGNGGYQIGVPNSPPISNIGDSSGNVILPKGLNVLSAVNLGLSAQLNLMAQNGRLTILAEPQLMARNGSKAKFLAGGEIPFVVSNLAGQSVFYKEYGIKLDIEPRINRDGVIRASVDSEVSAIDGSISTSGGPAFTKRQTTTEFNLKSGETMVLSGLISRNTSTTIDKVPGLGDLPILGALFRSKRYQNNETELVVFVTPSLVDSKSAGLADRVQQTMERLERVGGPPPHLSEPLQPGRDPANAARH